MRRVLHLKMVTQCAMLEDFGIFLVLADKVRLGIHFRAKTKLSPVAVRLPYRGFGSIVTKQRECQSDTTEIERKRSILQCGHAFGTNFSHLHEAKKRTVKYVFI